MKIYTISPRAKQWRQDITIFHERIFHGEGILQDGQYGDVSNCIKNKDRISMHIIRNAYMIPDVFIPLRSTSLVVSKHVADQIIFNFPRVEVYRVTFDKIYNIEWDLSDNRVENYIKFQKIKHLDPDEECLNILRKYTEDCVEIKDRLGIYYELIPCSYHVVKGHKPTKTFYHDYYANPGDDKRYGTVEVSEEMFLKYPIICLAHSILREDVFETIDKYLDRRFFGIKEFDFVTGRHRVLL